MLNELTGKFKRILMTGATGAVLAACGPTMKELALPTTPAASKWKTDAPWSDDPLYDLQIKTENKVFDVNARAAASDAGADKDRCISVFEQSTMLKPKAAAEAEKAACFKDADAEFLRDVGREIDRHVTKLVEVEDSFRARYKSATGRDVGLPLSPQQESDLLKTVKIRCQKQLLKYIDKPDLPPPSEICNDLLPSLGPK
jgi:hypothetical protein